MKPTKRQIQIVEHFVKKTTKGYLNEGNDPVNDLILKELNIFLKNLESKIRNIDNSFNVKSDGKQLGTYLTQLISIKYKG